MEDDRIVELAAEAHGGLIYVEGHGWIEDLGNGERGNWWHPRDDDGDAFRLAVICEFDVSIADGGTMVSDISGCLTHIYDVDSRKAARHAILIAAAQKTLNKHKKSGTV